MPKNNQLINTGDSYLSSASCTHVKIITTGEICKIDNCDSNFGIQLIIQITLTTWKIILSTRSWQVSLCSNNLWIFYLVQCTCTRSTKNKLKDSASFWSCAYNAANLQYGQNYWGFLQNLLTNIMVVLFRGVIWLYMWEKQILAFKGLIFTNAKRTLGVTVHFSEVIELKFGTKMPYVLCILKIFLELCLLNNLWKMHGYH